jgi:PAS domain S-box-containing protein
MTVDATREELRLLFDAALDAVIAMAPDGTIAAWNRQAETVFGWRRDEAIGQALASLIIPPDLREAHWKGLERFLATGEGPVINRRIEVRALRKDGREFPAELTILPLKQRERFNFFAFVRDISDAKSAEAQLTRRAFEAQVVYEATALSAEHASFEQILQGCLRGICRASGWSVGHVYLPDPLQTILNPGDVWYTDGVDLAEIRRVTQQTRFRLGEGLPGRIWASKKPHWIADIATDENFPRRFVFSPQGIKSAFGFPIYGDGRLLAVVEFFSKIAKQPDSQLLALAHSIGQQLGRAIERQQFFEQQRTLVKELSHRVSNIMTIVNAVFRQSLRYSHSLSHLDAAFTARLQALASATHLLTETDWKSAQLDKLIQVALRPHCPEGGNQCEIDGPRVELGARAVMPLSLVLHELGTNATKYGALSVPNGKLQIAWSEQRTNEDVRPILNLQWRERDGPRVEPPQRRGFGLDLIRDTVEAMGGKTLVEFNQSGLAVDLEMPLPARDP